jgi:hypothetical protein
MSATTPDDGKDLDFCDCTPTGDCADCEVTSKTRLAAWHSRPWYSACIDGREGG